MAGDWIKMRADLSDDPAVIGVAAELGIEEDHVVGKLHRLWSWANRQTADGNAPGVTKTWLDHYIGVTGFACALEKVGWLTCSDLGISFPNFDRHNSESAKQRALTANRVKRFRVTHKPLPEKRREEKRREKKNPLPPLPSELDTPAFHAAWESWVKHRSEIRKPLTQTQAEKQQNQFCQWGIERSIRAIEHTIGKGWQGIREPDAGGENGIAIRARVATDEELARWNPHTGVE